jgi:hypothetical protein
LWKYFESTFEYLNQHRINVQIFAGAKNTNSIPIEIVRGHARRVAGAFTVINSDVLTQDLTSNNISVIVSDSTLLQAQK